MNAPIGRTNPGRHRGVLTDTQSRHGGIHAILPCLLLLVILGSGCVGRLASQEESVRSRSLPRFPVILWVDWAGSGAYLASSDDAAANFCRLARRAGVTHLALEARTVDGANALGTHGAYYEMEERLRLAARDHGLKLAALVPSFLSKNIPDSERPVRSRWDDESGTWISLPLSTDIPAKTSPASLAARQEELRLFRDLLADHTLELILLSGFGFEDTQADLSPHARQQFEQWRGGAVRDWPQAVLGVEPPNLPFGREGRGPYWNSWVTWRARILRDLLVLMKGEMAGEEFPPHLVALVDAPYPSHQRLGLNWASPDTMAEVEHDWLPSDYGRRTASGHLLDAIGLIFWQLDLINATTAEREGFAWWASLEGAAAMARRYRRPNQSTPWFAIPVRPDTGWEAGVRGSVLLGGGVVLFPASAFLRSPSKWDGVSLSLRGAVPDES